MRASGGEHGVRADVAVAGAAFGVLALVAAAGAALYLAGRPVHASTAPFTAVWRPHLGPGTLPALVVAALVIRYGTRLATALPWRRLLLAAYAGSAAWLLSLALVDGWQRGIADRLTTRPEYLTEVPGVRSVPQMLHGFAARIVDGQPDSWTTHVSGHPPGALLVFVGLDRAGLRGGGWAALVCIAVAALAAVAVPVTVRVLGDESAARAAVPFLVMFPGAVWQGVSADGLFTGVAACGLAVLAVGLVRRRVVLGFAAGLVLGFCLFLSYGLTVVACLVIALFVLTRQWLTVAVAAVGGVLTVVAGFALAGFWWLDGMRLVSVRYYQGIASVRPYSYWVVADLALLAVAAGPAAMVVVRRAAVIATGRGIAAATDRGTVAPPGRETTPATGCGAGRETAAGTGWATGRETAAGTGRGTGAATDRGTIADAGAGVDAGQESAVEADHGAVAEADHGVVAGFGPAAEGSRAIVAEASYGAVADAGRGAVAEAGYGAVADAGRGAVAEVGHGAVAGFEPAAEVGHGVVVGFGPVAEVGHSVVAGFGPAAEGSRATVTEAGRGAMARAGRSAAAEVGHSAEVGHTSEAGRREEANRRVEAGRGVEIDGGPGAEAERSPAAVQDSRPGASVQQRTAAVTAGPAAAPSRGRTPARAGRATASGRRLIPAVLLSYAAVVRGAAAGAAGRFAVIRGRLGPAVLLPLAAVAAVLAADLSGYSKAEVERIWQPFAVWMVAGAVLIPAGWRRRWLVAQAVVALLVNHVLLTTW
ncbi:hypothetical protein [Actinoplanes sp. N902-109]|uniref:hypothetical protein n=1 Tax=Actinoplanes sp. (strain N902-109) TaxID=649831 RepID=UPI0018DE2D76|nr:hypothetical protein [Actinoplanes sp. N902-109]